MMSKGSTLITSKFPNKSDRSWERIALALLGEELVITNIVVFSSISFWAHSL